MTIQLAADATCDRCRATTSAVLVVDRLRPTVAMHLRLPGGWSATTKLDSGELYILCAACPADSTTLAPPPVVFSGSENEPTLAPPAPVDDD